MPSLEGPREAEATITWEYHLLPLEEIAKAMHVRTYGTRPDAELKNGGLLLVVKVIDGTLP